MKIAGTSVLHASPEKVWAAITDPAVLGGVIPGCQELTPLGENHFGLTVSMGVAAIRGSYAGEVQLYDMTEPSQLTMHAAGSGGPGTIDTTVEVRLADNGDGTTELSYDATATVGGPAGGVGQRVLSSVAKKTAGQFFSAIDDVITGKRSMTGKRTVSAPVGAPTSGYDAVRAGAPESTPAGAGSGDDQRPGFGRTLGAPLAASADSGLSPIAYLLIGAATTAIGVMLGARIARRR